MSKGRIYRAELTGVGIVKGRIYRAGLTGTAAINPKGRIYRAGLTGTAAVQLAAFTNRSVEPLTLQSITATLAAGSDTPDSYTWRVVPGGTAVTLVGSGATITCLAPATLAGTFVVIGVRGVKGALISPEQTIRIDTPPQQEWFPTPTGWIPARPVVAFS